MGIDAILKLKKIFPLFKLYVKISPKSIPLAKKISLSLSGRFQSPNLLKIDIELQHVGSTNMLIGLELCTVVCPREGGRFFL